MISTTRLQQGQPNNNAIINMVLLQCQAQAGTNWKGYFRVKDIIAVEWDLLHCIEVLGGLWLILSFTILSFFLNMELDFGPGPWQYVYNWLE